jgi:hypothetical protein
MRLLRKEQGEGSEIWVSSGRPKEPGISQCLRTSPGKARYVTRPRGWKELVDLIVEAVEFVGFAKRNYSDLGL